MDSLPKWARRRIAALTQLVADMRRTEMLLADEKKLFAALEASIHETTEEGSPVRRIVAAVVGGRPIRMAIRRELLDSNFHPTVTMKGPA